MWTSQIRPRLYLALLLPLCALGAVLALARMGWSVLSNPAKAWGIALSLDRAANGGINGDPRETISARAGRARTAGRRWGCVLCRLLDTLDRDHCARAAVVERKGRAT